MRFFVTTLLGFALVFGVAAGAVAGDKVQDQLRLKDGSCVALGVCDRDRLQDGSCDGDMLQQRLQLRDASCQA